MTAFSFIFWFGVSISLGVPASLAQAPATPAVAAPCSIAFENLLELYQMPDEPMNPAIPVRILNLLKETLEAPLGFQVSYYEQAKYRLRVRYTLQSSSHQLHLDWVTQNNVLLESKPLADSDLQFALRRNGKLRPSRYRGSLDLLKQIAKDRLFLVLSRGPTCESLQNIQNNIQK